MTTDKQHAEILEVAFTMREASVDEGFENAAQEALARAVEVLRESAERERALRAEVERLSRDVGDLRTHIHDACTCDACMESEL